MKRATRDNITYCDSRRYFNPRPREEGDFLDRYSKIIDNDFNPRPREEGDTKFIIKLYTILNFNPRPREEGDTLILFTTLASAISIHALVKRATDCGTVFDADEVISIHALVKRATCAVRLDKPYYRDFNPRPREEGDSQGQDACRAISYFNPRPREEGDDKIHNQTVHDFEFQSTPS